MSYNPVLRWNKPVATSPTITSYHIAWTRNGVPAGILSVQQTTPNDSLGYSSPWSAANPTVTLLGNDVVSATIYAVDGTNNLSSPPVTSSNLTIPNDPPQPPTNVTLALS